MRSVFGSIGFIVAAVWRVDRRTFLLATIETLAGFAWSARPLAYGAVVAGAVSSDPPLVIVALALLLVSTGASLLLNLVGTDARLRLSETMRHHFDTRIAAMSGEMATLRHLTDPDVQDRIGLIISRRGALGSAVNSLLNAARALGQPVVLIMVAVGADLRMGLVALAAVPIALVAAPQVRWGRTAETDGAPGGRQAERLLAGAHQPSVGAELRVFGARQFLLDRLDRAVLSWRGPYRRAEQRTALLRSAVTTGYFAVAGVVLAWLTYDAVGGGVTPGALTVALTSVVGLLNCFGAIQFGADQVATVTRTVQRYRWFEQYVAEEDRAHTGDRPVPDRLTDGIRLRDLRFRYPGTDVDVVQGIDLHVPAGTTVAVVGENGAAKSTLVGLLTGMYDIGSGSITIDGIELADLDLAGWRRRCSGTFQDHLRPELRVDEAVALGDLDLRGAGDDPPVTGRRFAEVVAAADVDQVIDRLPDGVATQLGRQWPGGVDLSGGQWQRLALARGMMRQDALLTVLDEPTSALDPTAEDRLLAQYAAVADQTRERGGITMIITHRLSTVSAADLVVVMHQGTVAEVGTHDELLAAGGRYAELYGLQARGYLSTISGRQN